MLLLDCGKKKTPKIKGSGVVGKMSTPTPTFPKFPTPTP